MTHYRERLEAGEFQPPASSGGLDEMSKAELLEEAARRGVTVSADWTKAEIREALEG